MFTAKNSITVIAAASALLLTASSCSKEKKSESHSTPVIDVAAVETDSVIVHDEYPGYLSATREVDLVARVDGYLTSKPDSAGIFVKAGSVLYTIEDTAYADAVKQAEASLADAVAAESYARSHYSAMEKALQSDAVSRMEVLEAKSSLESATAAVSTARAQLESARTTLGYCTVRAPFDGRITSCSYSVGAFLSGSAQPVRLATIYDDSKVTVSFAVDDATLADIDNSRKDPALMKLMDSIPLTFDTGTRRKYTADMSYLSPAVDKTTGSMTVQADIKNPDGELRSAMYCKIMMPKAVLPHAVLVRDASVATNQLGKYVYVVNDSDRVVYTPITVGEIVNDSMRVVTKGLRPGDRYVTEALLKVRDGMTVTPRLVNKH